MQQALSQLQAGVSKPRTPKRLEKVGQPKAAAQFQINVQADGASAKAVALSWQRQPAGNSVAAHPGVSCLRTNLTAWDTQLWSPSVRLPDLEAVFRPLGAATPPLGGERVGDAPDLLGKPQRADAHLFVTVLAYQLASRLQRNNRDAALGRRNRDWANPAPQRPSPSPAQHPHTLTPTSL